MSRRPRRNHSAAFKATLHRAKGPEFDQVVVVGRQEALGDLEETAQERMLLYVALTRAK